MKRWQAQKLGELCEINLGKTPARKNSSYWDAEKNGSNVWLSIADLPVADKATVFDSKEYISDAGAALGRPVQAGTLLLSFKLTLGRMAFAGRDLYTNEAIASLPILNEEMVTKDYLYWYLSYFDWNKASDGDIKIKGRTLNKAKLGEIPVSVPPLTEQQRIVAILDEAFAGIASAVETTEKNLENAKDVYRSHIESIFDDKSDWKTEKLAAITSKIGSGATPRGGQKSYKSEGISLIRSMNVHDMGFEQHNLAYIDDDQASKLSNVQVEEQDVLLNITGASVARCCIVDSAILPARVNQHVAIVRTVPEILDPKFLHLELISTSKKSELLEIGEEGGSTRQAITKSQIQQLDVSFPKSVNQQQEVVSTLQATQSKTDKLQSIYRQKLDALAELKQSILEKAFQGELTNGSDKVLAEAGL